MKKPKWRKYKNEWRRGVLVVERSIYTGRWAAVGIGGWINTYRTPEAAMKAADAWWERTRWKMEGK